jgi:predicted ATPase
MKIDSIFINNQAPINRFEVEDLSNIVVVAGPNGVGKTSLMILLLHALSVQAPPQAGKSLDIHVIVSATNE